MAKDFHALQKGAVIQHISKASNLKGQLHEGSMESLATTIRFVTVYCRIISTELQQAALSRLLRYLCVPFAALQETRMRDRPVISIENYTTYCGDAEQSRWLRDSCEERLQEPGGKNMAQRRLDTPFYDCRIAEDVNSRS
ncbi:hypothetical protein RB195_002338 [Necator americanus]|uniref:Uncharacterized protein n=1 Tax=Necator americanus TaxID=51031 RepID=A0ABR1DK43_NECAM